MADAKEYTVEYDGTTLKFTATDGVVATVGIDKTQIDAATETEVKAEAKDANGVVIDTKAYGDAKLSMTFNVTNGYLNGTKLYLNKAGDTATVDVTYHKGTFDTTGKEELIEAKGLVVTAVEPEKITVAGWATKIGAASKTFDTVTETKIAVGDTRTAYVQITNSKNEKSVDMTGYTVESSNKDALIIGKYNAANGTIVLTAVKEGTSYILVKDSKGNVVTTLPVSIVAARKATSIALDKTNVTLSSTIDETTDIKVTVKDQYTEEVATTTAKLETLSFTAPGAATTTSTQFDNASASLTNGKFTVDSDSVPDGKYVVKVTAEDLSTTFTVNVVSTTASTKTSHSFEMDTTTADAVITKTAGADTKLTAKVYRLNEGIKTAVLTSGAINVSLTNSKNEAAKVGNETAASVDAQGNIEIKVNDISSGNKLAAGSYTLTVSGTGVPTFKRTIVITDTQTKVSVKRDAEKAASVNACFKFFLENEEITPVSVVYYNGDNDITSSTGLVTPVTKAVVTYTYGGNKVIQTVTVGLTVTID